MASTEPQVHRLGLGRVVVEGNRQPIVRIATLTLKDEHPDKHIMQVHVDGNTLAQWDLGKLNERKSTGGEQFFSISEQNMLHFTLPLLEEGQTFARGTELKTIQLFLRTPQDFHTAVHYLSQNAGLRHCHLKNVSANLIDAKAPQHAQSQPQESSRVSIMEPPMRPPMRPRSQSSVFASAGQSPVQFVRRPQTARPNSTLANLDPPQHPPRPSTAVPLRGRIPPQVHRHRSSLPQRAQDPRSFFAPDGFSQHQQSFGRSPGAGGIGDMISLYDHGPRRASIASHAPSTRLVQYNGRELLPSHHRVQANAHRVLGSFYHDGFDGASMSQAGHFMSSTSHPISTGASLFEKHSSSRPSPEGVASRSLAVSERGAPIKIQVLGPPDEPSHSYSRPKIRWEFTLHLVPSTQIFELCLHAASYIRREYRFTVDGRALAAQSRDGIVFGDQDTLPHGILQGEALFLIERKLLGKVEPAPINLGASYWGPLHPDWRSEASKLDKSRLQTSEETSSQVIDENDRVPSPRQLPFPSVAASGLPRSSSSTVEAPPPLSERPDLMNTSTQMSAGDQVGQAIGQKHNRTKAVTKKPPSSHRNRPRSASIKPASSAIGSRVESVSTTKHPSEPRALRRRPETSLGIRPNRKASLTDAGVCPAMPPVRDTAPSGAELSKSERATVSCVGCRNKKRKCDRVKPACGPCLKENRSCTYPNIREKAVTDSTADKAPQEQDLVAVTHSMALRGRAVTSQPPMSDALTQTSHSWESRDIGVQTQFINTKDVRTDLRNLYTDASVDAELHNQYTNASVETEPRNQYTNASVETEPRNQYTNASVETEPCNQYINASVETERCDEIWLSLPQAAEVLLWGYKRYDEQIEKGAQIFRTADPSQEDYRGKLEQAAVLAVEFEYELRDKCEEILRR